MSREFFSDIALPEPSTPARGARCGEGEAPAEPQGGSEHHDWPTFQSRFCFRIGEPTRRD